LVSDGNAAADSKIRSAGSCGSRSGYLHNGYQGRTIAVRTDIPPDKTTTRSPVRDCAARFSGLIAEICRIVGPLPLGEWWHAARIFDNSCTPTHPAPLTQANPIAEAAAFIRFQDRSREARPRSPPGPGAPAALIFPIMAPPSGPGRSQVSHRFAVHAPPAASNAGIMKKVPNTNGLCSEPA
jgi:hypothetical protein